MYGVGYKLEKVKEIAHDLNHDLTFYCIINCVCHSIRSMFRVLGIYNFARQATNIFNDEKQKLHPFLTTKAESI